MAERIVGALKLYNIEEEKIYSQARMLIGPYEFEVLMYHASKRNFTLHTSKQGREDYENHIRSINGEDYARGAFERHVVAVTNLCRDGLLGLHTSSSPENDGHVHIQFSYHWTELGNAVLEMMKLIKPDEREARRTGIPAFF